MCIIFILQYAPYSETLLTHSTKCTVCLSYKKNMVVVFFLEMGSENFNYNVKLSLIKAPSVCHPEDSG